MREIMFNSVTWQPKIWQRHSKGRSSPEKRSHIRAVTNRTARRQERSKPENRSKKNNAGKPDMKLKQSGEEWTPSWDLNALGCTWLAGARWANESQVWHFHQASKVLSKNHVCNVVVDNCHCYLARFRSIHAIIHFAPLCFSFCR